MDTQYGFAAVVIDGVSYTLAPTLSNMAKIGTPKEIVYSFADLSASAYWGVRSLCAAIKILQACGLPSNITGEIVWSHHSKTRIFSIGKIPVIDDIRNLAWHCLKHGVIGNSKSKSTASGSDNYSEEFNPHQYISAAMKLFNLSLSEAEGLTMTKLVYLLESLPEKSEEKAKNAEAEKAMVEYERRVAAKKAKRALNNV